MSARGRAARMRILESGGEIHVPAVPPHIVEKHGSAREWKALKREQLRVALRAVGELRIGAAFFPRPAGKGYSSDIDAAEKALTSLNILLSRKIWGR